MSIKDYWILFECGEDDSAIIETIPEDQIEDWELNLSISLRERVKYPINIRFSMDFPRNIKLYDFLDNTQSVLIVSEKVMAVFEGLNINKLEYLPANVYDHKDNLVSTKYYIINILDRQPIVDMDRSKYKMSHIAPDKILSLRELRLTTNGVDANAKLFRMTNEDSYHLITTEVLNALKNAGVSGLRFIPADGWNGRELIF